MKTNLLKTITRSLNETEDMFPGISSSAFDEHNKQKAQAPLELTTTGEELDWLDKEVEKFTEIHMLAWRESDRIAFFLENNEALEQGKPGPHDIDYREVMWLRREYPSAWQRVKGFFAKSTSPIFDDIPKYLIRLNRALDRKYETGETLEELNDRMDEVNG